MKNIAIVVGVTEYQRLTQLPGSKNDAENIYKILQLTDKYADILYLNEDDNSQKIKENLTNFIEKNNSNEIDELFFYFSGHGEFIGEEFFYLLVDYDQFKKNQTSLQNSFIDDLFRSLSPKNTIKVIDACQSGNQYIKDSSTITNYLDKSKNHLKNCYFLFSSQSNQSSFQSKYISDFTNSFINSLKNSTTSDIRYRHIVDYIADDFISNSEQKPMFIIQAENTEKFCTINLKLREFLDEYTGTNTIALIATGKSLANSLIKDSNKYCSMDEAQKIIESLKEIINSYKINEEINSIYSYSVNYPTSLDGIKNLEPIARFINNSKEENYFAKVEFTSKLIEEPIYSEPYHNEESFYPSKKTGVKMKEIEVPSRFDLTFETTYRYIDIDVIPNLEHLTAFNGKILFIITRKNIRFFTSKSYYIENTWDSKRLKDNLEWSTNEIELKNEDEIKIYLNTFNESLNEFIMKHLQEKFEINDEGDKK